jgi:DNA polymerase-3 subunit beta
MRIENIDRRELVAALQLCAKVAPAKWYPLPILTYAHVTATGRGIMLHATNLEQWVRASVRGVPCPGYAGRECLLPIAPALKALRASKAKTVDVSADAERVSLHLMGNVARFPAMPVAEYPTIPDGGAAADVRASGVSAEKLRRALEAVSYAMSRDQTRLNLCGVRLNPTADGCALDLAATDGHRLACATVEIEGDPFAAHAAEWDANWSAARPREVILPAPAVPALDALLKGARPGAVALFGIGGDPEQFALKCGDALLTSRLTDGEFPPVENVIPKDAGETLAVHPRYLAEAVAEILPHTPERSRAVKVEMVGGNCTLYADVPDRGDATARCALARSGPTAVFGMNATYLRDALAPFVAADVEEIELHYRDGDKPIKLTSKGCDFFAVLMPMRL